MSLQIVPKDDELVEKLEASDLRWSHKFEIDSGYVVSVHALDHTSLVRLMCQHYGVAILSERER